MIQAWYEGHTEAPVTVTTAAELDAVLDDVAAAGAMQIAQLITDGDITRPHLFVGLNGDRGTLRYAGPGVGVWYSRKPGEPFPLPPWGEVIYYFARADFEYPDDAEIPAGDVREAAHAFLSSGGERPPGVEWTEEPAPAINPSTS
jgi:immunity protein Imm1 of predicted polymorphic toxin system